MPLKDPDVWGLVGALLISIISGFISIAQRLVRGHPWSVIWLLGEFMAAILVGYLIFDAYPMLVANDIIPVWVTMPIAVALGAHFGGRAIQFAGSILGKRWGFSTNDGPPPPAQ